MNESRLPLNFESQAEENIVPSKKKVNRRKITAYIIYFLLWIAVSILFLIGKEFVSKQDQKAAVEQQKKAELMQLLGEEKSKLEKSQVREQRLIEDLVYLEYVMRDKLELAAPGETLILIDQDNLPD